MSVAAFPMSIWPQAMSYARPSSEVARVRPVIPCLLAVYAADRGRGTCAAIDPLLMIRPPRGTCVLHEPERTLGHQERAGQIGLDDRAPGLDRQVLDRGGRRPSPGVVEQQVEPPEAVADRREQGVHGRLIGDVSRDHDGLRAGVPAQLRGLLERRRLPTGQHDREARRRPARPTTPGRSPNRRP